VLLTTYRLLDRVNVLGSVFGGQSYWSLWFVADILDCLFCWRVG